VGAQPRVTSGHDEVPGLAGSSRRLNMTLIDVAEWDWVVEQ
jgi:hypothetical protein